MALIPRIWDFFFGAILIGASFILAFVLAALLGTEVVARMEYFGFVFRQLSRLLEIALPCLCVWGAVRWRRRHRLVSVELLTFEAITGIALGLVFIFFWIAFTFFGALS